MAPIPPMSITFSLFIVMMLCCAIPHNCFATRKLMDIPSNNTDTSEGRDHRSKSGIRRSESRRSGSATGSPSPSGSVVMPPPTALTKVGYFNPGSNANASPTNNNNNNNNNYNNNEGGYNYGSPPASTVNPNYESPPASTVNTNYESPPASTVKYNYESPPTSTVNPNYESPPASTVNPNYESPPASTVNQNPSSSPYSYSYGYGYTPPGNYQGNGYYSNPGYTSPGSSGYP